MVQQKTGGLFRLSVLLMQAFSESKADYIPLVNDLGLYYQVLDDYLNLQSEAYHTNKSYCEDLTEGKYSFPIVHAITNATNNTLANILRQRPTDNDVKKFAVDTMSEVGSFDYTEKFRECRSISHSSPWQATPARAIHRLLPSLAMARRDAESASHVLHLSRLLTLCVDSLRSAPSQDEAGETHEGPWRESSPRGTPGRVGQGATEGERGKQCQQGCQTGWRLGRI